MPCSVEWFFQHVTMAFGTKNDTTQFHPDQTLHKVHIDNLTTFTYKHSPSKTVYSHEPPIDNDNLWFRMVGNGILDDLLNFIIYRNS
jgi:hypothetical protein